MQTVPHEPQFAPSDIVFTHAEPQAARPPMQRHEPFEQLWPWPHECAHAPQLLLSVSELTHVAAQTSCPAPQPLLAPALPPLGAPPLVLLRPAEPPLENSDGDVFLLEPPQLTATSTNRAALR